MTTTQALIYAEMGRKEIRHTCTYVDSNGICGQPSVPHTEGGWCSEHGIVSELYALQMDLGETRPEYMMTAEDRDFAMSEIAKYQAAALTQVQ